MKYDEIIETANFPKRIYNFIFSKDFKKDKILPTVQKHIKGNFANGICLVGNVGIGKTVSIIYLLIYLIKTFLKENIDNESIEINRPLYVEYNDLHILYKMYERGFHTKANEKHPILDPAERRYLKYRRTKRILFIDDIVTGWDMFDLINYRYNNNLITFLNSNLEFEDFKNSLGAATISRIKEDMVLDFINEKDMRGGFNAKDR